MNSYRRRKKGIECRATASSVRSAQKSFVAISVAALKKRSPIDRYSSHTLKGLSPFGNSIDAVWQRFWQSQTGLVGRKNSLIEAPVFNTLAASIEPLSDAESDVLHAQREGTFDFATASATEGKSLAFGSPHEEERRAHRLRYEILILGGWTTQQKRKSDAPGGGGRPIQAGKTAKSILPLGNFSPIGPLLNSAFYQKKSPPRRPAGLSGFEPSL